MGSALEKEIDQLRGVLWSERDPQGRVFVPLADAYRRMGDLPLARSMIEEGLERLPDFASAHVVAGWIHQDLVSPVEAEQSFLRVLELDPDNTIALEAMGGLAGARGSHAEAAEYRRRLEALDPQADADDQGSDQATEGAAATEDDVVQDTVPDIVQDGAELSDASDDEDSSSVIGALGAAAAVASAGILLEDAGGEDDSHFETLDFDDGPSAEDAEVGIAVADLAPDPDATVELAIGDLAPEAASLPAETSVADLAPDIDEPPATISVAELAPAEGDVEQSAAEHVESEDGPNPLAAMPVGELAPELEATEGPGSDGAPEAIGIADLAPPGDAASEASEAGVGISDLAPDDDDSGAVELTDSEEPFDFGVADLSAGAATEEALAASDSEDAETWVEPVGGFLVNEATQDEEVVEEGLSVSSVFRSLLDYEPLPASEELGKGDADTVADWNWSPVEADENGAASLEADGARTEAADSPDEASAAAEGDAPQSDSDEPGPDDFQAWLERNSL